MATWFEPLLVATTVLVTSGCQSGRVSVTRPHRPAEGRAIACPDRPVDPMEEGLASPMSTRCSYDDAIGAGVTIVKGHVLAEEAPGIPGTGVPDLDVTVHRLATVHDKPTTANQVAHASTNTQGEFHLSAILKAGDYVFVARVRENGSAIAQMKIALEGDGSRTLDDVVLWLPLDRRLAPSR